MTAPCHGFIWLRLLRPSTWHQWGRECYYQRGRWVRFCDRCGEQSLW